MTTEDLDPPTADDHVDRPVPTRRQLWFVAVTIGILFAGNQIGNVAGPDWVNERPLLLLFFSSLLRWQVLVVNQIEPVGLFVLVASVRLLVADPLFYLLGFWYGDSAIKWVEHRSPSVGRGARKFEQYFAYAAYPLVVIMPNNPVCLLAGVNRMRPVVFAALNVVGTLGRVILIIWLGKRLQEPIDDVLGFIAEYRWYLIALSIPVVVISSWRELSLSAAEVETLAHGDGHDDDRSAEVPK